MSLQLLHLALCPLLSLLYLPLALCSALPPTPRPNSSFHASCPCLALYVSPRLLSALSVSDESSGIGMKVTQGNKGPAVPTVVGVESSTQEFPARLPNPGGLLPCTMGLYRPGTGPDASRSSPFSPLIARCPLATQSAPSAATSVMGGLSCLLHSCPRALWEQLAGDKGLGESTLNSSYLLG